MSAIFGLVNLEGRSVAETDLYSMGIALRAHGPDGYGIWAGKRIGLGQRLRCFTPEDRFERQPLGATEGHHILVTDGRVDNRPELMRELGILPREASKMPDSAFILRAYQKWGLDCCGRLLGDFVFALCDLHEGLVLVARSAMSRRSLYYHLAPGILAFASAPKGLFALPWIRREINQQRLADYLVQAPREPGSTFYAGVSELDAGNAIVIRGEGFRLQRHWQPDFKRETRYPRDSDYEEAFTTLFDRVIADYMRSLTPVGVMMSGGLDSSSVAVAAARLLAPRGQRLSTFTEVPRAGFDAEINTNRYADETPFVEAIARKWGNIDVNFARTSSCFLLDGVDSLFRAAEVPFQNAWNRAWIETIMRQARDQNVRVLLTGAPGNFTISRGGDGLFPQLIRRGRWIRAFREAMACSRQDSGASPLRVLARGAAPLLPTPLWLVAGRLFHPGNPIFRASPPWLAYSAIHPDFARFHRVGERAHQKGHDFLYRAHADTSTGWRAFLRHYDSGIHASRGTETLYGVERRNPTGDVRIVEFCMSLPEEQYHRDGISRSLIRRAMRNRLPLEVLANKRRGLQAADWFERAIAGRSRMLDELEHLERSELAVSALDLKRVRALVRQIPEVDNGEPPVFANGQTILGSAFMTGSFLRWLESSGSEDTNAAVA